MDAPSIVVVAGGVGAARFLAGLVQIVPPATVSAVVNTADDFRLGGLAISPDLDTCTYTLAGLVNPETGWGRSGESWTVMDALEELGGPTWFRLGDRDLATHLYRTQRLAEGAPLSAITAELCERFGVATRLVPMTDDVVATRLDLATGEQVEFQDYFVRRRHADPVTAVHITGVEQARPAPGVLDLLATADRIVIAPSNPILSVAPVLGVPGIRDALAVRRDDVVAVSPIVGGAALKGPADRLLRELGHESTPAGVARLYADVVATFVLDAVDAGTVDDVAAVGVRPVTCDTVMRDADAAATLAKHVLDA